MNGDRQMLPVHTIRIRAGSPIIEIRSAHTRELGDIGSWHGLDCPWPYVPAEPVEDHPQVLGPAVSRDRPRGVVLPTGTLLTCRRQDRPAQYWFERVRTVASSRATNLVAAKVTGVWLSDPGRRPTG